MNVELNIDACLEPWTRLATVSQEQINKCKFCADDLQPLYYIDVNGKEWIVLLMPEVDCEKENKNDCDGYLYDVENDKLLSFIKSYETDINQRFNIYKQHSNNVNSSRKVFKSYVIDNDNHIMYWYACVYIQGAKPYGMIIAFDIKDLINIQLLYQTNFETNNEIFQFSCNRHTYKMVMIGNNRMELVLGGVNGWSHYEFNTITQELKLITDYIVSKNINHVTYKKISNYVENLRIGDFIDARYLKGKSSDDENFYLSQIVDIKDKKFNDDNVLISMKINMHYNEKWSGNKGDEWIDLFNRKQENQLLLKSLCDCNEKCNDKYHEIGLPKCQSYFGKYPIGWSAIYSKSAKKLCVFGQCINVNWSGLYWKGYQEYKLIVDGFIHEFEKSNTFSDYNYSYSYCYNYNIIPNDLKQLIFQYYVSPNNNEWTQARKMAKNGIHIKSLYGYHFMSNMGSVIVNDDNDILLFGGCITRMTEPESKKKKKRRKRRKRRRRGILKLNVITGDMQRLTDIVYPIRHDGSYAVFCNKSQSIHLFTRDFAEHYSIPLQSLNNSSTAKCKD